ncbi:O-antigen ligase [Desulfosporosinus acididurans]|uniref:O-antigen ligase n=1 Tax=Desulfosporosinus acididurans TaxID=476652 RepID=A0A0J1FT29_9FIRM|nr:O-antigen ligase family protein [Desulfosporosinus acididurans]KLU66123.1 O-antigen ligase [Desulfosporosinus acididurans]
MGKDIKYNFNEKYCGFLVGYILIVGYLILSVYEAYINGAFGAYTKYYIIALAMILLIMTNFKLVRNYAQTAVIIWYWLYLVSILWASNNGWEQYFLTITAMVAFMFIITGIRFTTDVFDSLMTCFLVISLSLGIFGLFFSQSFDWGTRNTLYLLGVYMDPNGLDALYGIGTGLSLYNLFVKKKLQILSGLTLLINAYGIFMSGSRSGLVILIAQIVLVIFLGEERQKPIDIVRKLFVLIIVLALIGIIASLYVPTDVLDRILGLGPLKFIDGTGRLERWSTGLNMWWNEGFLFGCGWGTYECHGTFFTMLVDVGLVGTSVFFSILIWIFAKAFKQRNIVALMLIISGIIPGALIGAQNQRFFWNSIIFSTVAVLSKQRELQDDLYKNFKMLEAKSFPKPLFKKKLF